MKKTAAICGAAFSADHRLIAASISWKIRPKMRRRGVTKKELNCDALKDEARRVEFQAKVQEVFQNRVDQQSS